MMGSRWEGDAPSGGGSLSKGVGSGEAWAVLETSKREVLEAYGT